MELVVGLVLSLVGAIVGVEYGRWRARSDAANAATTAESPAAAAANAATTAESPAAAPKRPRETGSQATPRQASASTPATSSTASPPRTTEDYGDIGAWAGAFAGILGGPAAVWDEWGAPIDADFLLAAAVSSSIFALLGVALGRLVGLAYGALKASL